MLGRLFYAVFGRVLNMVAAEAEQDMLVQSSMNTANRKATLTKEANRLREGGYEEQAQELEALAEDMTISPEQVSVEYRETAPLAIEDQTSGRKKRR